MAMHHTLRMKLTEPDSYIRFHELFRNAKASSINNTLHRANRLARAEGKLGEFYYSCGKSSGDPVIARHPEDIAAECHASPAAARRYANRARARFNLPSLVGLDMSAPIMKGPPVPMKDLPSGHEVVAHALDPYSED